MPFITQGKANLKYILIVVILASIVGGGVWLALNRLTFAPPSPSFGPGSDAIPPDLVIDETADWKSYRNDEYGFEIKYPSVLAISSAGPNVVQQALEKGEQISGTVRPSFDTIIFSDQDDQTQFAIGIFYPKEEIFSEEGYSSDYFYLYGPCDLRWGFEPTIINTTDVNNIEILAVKGEISTDLVPQSFLSCYYFKNYSKNLIVLNTGRFEEQQTFEGVDSILRSVLSSLIIFEAEEISNWKTYRNEKYGFEIKYPPEIGQLEKVLEHDDYLDFIYEKYGDFPMIITNILIKEKPKSVLFENFLDYLHQESLGDMLCSGCFGYDWKKTLTIHGNPSLMASVVSHPLGRSLRGYVLGQDSKTVIEIVAVGKDGISYPPDPGFEIPQQDITAFSQILSTFKFLE